MIHKVKLRPFRVPIFVHQEASSAPRHEGFSAAPAFALKELDDDTLSGLCDEFRAAVFREARRPDPRQQESE